MRLFYKENPTDILQSLQNVCSVSSHERPVREQIIDLLEDMGYNVKVIDLNLAVDFGKKTEEYIEWNVHMDTIGFEVRKVKKHYAYLEKRGYMASVEKNTRLTAYADEGVIDGFILSSPIFGNLYKAKFESPLKVTTPVKINSEFKIQDGHVYGQIDNLGGVACTLSALYRLRDKEVPLRHRLLVSWGEELGLLGTYGYLKNINNLPRCAYVIDTTNPVEEKIFVGNGLVLKIQDCQETVRTSEKLNDFLHQLSASENITIQDKYAISGCTNSYLYLRKDIPTAAPALAIHNQHHVMKKRVSNIPEITTEYDLNSLTSLLVCEAENSEMTPKCSVDERPSDKLERQIESLYEKYRKRID